MLSLMVQYKRYQILILKKFILFFIHELTKRISHLIVCVLIVLKNTCGKIILLELIPCTAYCRRNKEIRCLQTIQMKEYTVYDKI